MKISVVILNYNVRYFLELCLQSVEAALTAISSEIIVIDNHSSDGSCAMVESLFPQVKLIRNQENIGFSKANNKAVKLAQGEYICILNPDTFLTEDTFDKILKFSEQKSNLGIVGSRFIDGSGNFLPECKRSVPSLSTSIAKLLGNGQNYYANSVGEKAIAKVSVLTGAFMWMRRDLFIGLEGFDEDFFMYGEDIDLSYRALKMNFENYYYGAATTMHFKGESSPKNKLYYKRFYKAMQLFHDKHFKTNFLLRRLVDTATNLAPYFIPSQKAHSSVSKQMVFLNPRSKAPLKNLTNPIVIKDIMALPKDTPSDVVFDTQSDSFLEIVEKIDAIDSSQISFKFWPKNSDYCVGSDTSKQRGEVVVFGKSESRTSF